MRKHCNLSHLLVTTLLALSACTPAVVPDMVGMQGQRLPARCTNDLVYLELPIRAGRDTLTLYTDTGGGLFLLGAAADRIGVPDSVGARLSELGDGSFPDPLGSEEGTVPIFRDPGSGLDHDGMLGQGWFADRVWLFDYAGCRLLLLPEEGRTEPAGAAAPLAFKTDSTGRRVLHFPRIQIVVSRDTLDMLLDTGAQLSPTAAGAAILGGVGTATRATSFITTEVLDQWRKQHPEWRVVAGGDTMIDGMRLIEVPSVEVAGIAVGPVWFTERPTKNFREFMAQWMDRPVDGAIGGNLFRFFTMTVDYPSAAAYFAPGRLPRVSSAR